MNNREDWLTRKITTLDALYRRFGRDGFWGQQVGDVELLLLSKELRMRDEATRENHKEGHQLEFRQLELEINDIRTYLQSCGRTSKGRESAAVIEHESPDHGMDARCREGR